MKQKKTYDTFYFDNYLQLHSLRNVGTSVCDRGADGLAGSFDAILQTETGYMEKLVRDKVPEFSAIKKDARVFRRLSTAEQLPFLAEKILEEAKEVQDAMYNGTAEQVMEELADVLEVVQTICWWRGITWGDVEGRQIEKRNKKGGFDSFTAMRLPRTPDETI